MQNLLQIETAFIASIRFESGSLSQLHSAQDAETDSRKAAFEASLKQAKHLQAAYAWFASDSAKAEMEEALGTAWNKTEFVQKALRYGARTTPDLLVRVQTRIDEHPTLLTKYKREQTRLAGAGEKAPRSIQHFDKWSRALLDEVEETGAEVEEAIEEAEVEATPTSAANLGQFRFKHPVSGNIVANCDVNGVVDTTNSRAELAESIIAFAMFAGIELRLA
mgnify:CR=1 FL=1